MKRRFRGLRREGPDRHYDAVVIGAGIGGLITANLLAREGLRVLLTEQHYMAGGYCSTFRRAGYTFDAATHFYPLLGNPDTLTGRLLEELGVTTGWVQMDPVDTFHFPDGSSFRVPADLARYRRELALMFPDEASSLDSFFQLVERAYLLGLLHYFRSQGGDRVKQLGALDLKEVLDRYFRSRKLKLLLAADCAHWGSPPSRTSFVFDSMLRLSYFLGNFYPVGGSQAFADELAHRFEELGGHILMSSRVERILLRDGTARGVAIETLRGPLRGRRTVDAEFVVSNADLLQTLDVLIGRDELPRGYRESLTSLRTSFPCFLVHLGLRGVSEELLDRIQGYYWSDWDADEVGRDALRCKVFVPTLYEPALAPDGGQIVILQKVQEIDYASVDDWDAHKRSVEHRLIAHLEALIPELERHTVVKTSASAFTSARFTLNTHGAMLGWEMAPDQLGDARPDIELPIKNLFLTGHWTRPGGGITPVIVSAQRVAEAIGGRRRAAETPPTARATSDLGAGLGQLAS